MKLTLTAIVLRGLPLLLLLFTIAISVSDAQLQPTLFKNNRVYALQNHHAGNYLTVRNDGSGQMHRTPDRGMHAVDQLWMVMAINAEGFKLVPLNGEPALDTLWRPRYLGEGNYQLQNVENGNCLEASQKGLETPCHKDNLFQQWFPTLKNEEQVRQILH